jgi:dihydrofolate reductase
MRRDGRVTAIVAMDRNDLIGSNGALPWPRLRAECDRLAAENGKLKAEGHRGFNMRGEL